MMKGTNSFNTSCFSSTNSVFNAMEIPKGPLFRVHSDSSVLLSSIIKNLSIKHVVTTDVPVLLVGDAYRAEHVISNLLCNAIKFSLQDGTIYMEAISQIIPNTETSTSSAGVPVSISDEGPRHICRE